jgi:hypothetical protein
MEPPGEGVQPEVQARGPLHEGFAQPNTPPRRGPLVRRQPPAPIREVPPDQKPEGSNVVWLPGYWAWDDDRGDFLWVSGFWRVVPPGRRWVPGYWARSSDGWRWVSGLWVGSSQTEIPYVDQQPPASLERGPSVPEPDDDYDYSPGTWMRRQGQYVWRPGFWYRPRPGLVYCPPRWAWTPSGYLYVSGYWDHDLEDRGMLFAPCFIPQTLWAQPGWSFSPSYTVSVPALLASLWVRPSWGNYAFGDYYSSRYARLGYQPWLSYGPRYRDPLYGYYAWRARGDSSWRRGLVSLYNGRVRGDLALPPRTLAAQRRLAARGESLSRPLHVVGPMGSFRSDRQRLTRLSAEERAASARRAQDLGRASAQRRSLEARRSGRTLASNRLPANRRVQSTRRPTGTARTAPRTTTRSRAPVRRAPTRYGAPRAAPRPRMTAPRGGAQPRRR